MSRRNSVRIGKVGEDIATMQLRLLGVEMLETVHTGWKVIKWIKPPEDGRAGVAEVAPAERVSGDRLGILPGGRRVLVEVKTRDSNTLSWSALKDHQHQALSENGWHGGLSLLVWVQSGQVHVMDYGLLLVAGFKPGRGGGITEDMIQSSLWGGVKP